MITRYTKTLFTIHLIIVNMFINHTFKDSNPWPVIGWRTYRMNIISIQVKYICSTLDEYYRNRTIYQSAYQSLSTNICLFITYLRRSCENRGIPGSSRGILLPFKPRHWHFYGGLGLCDLKQPRDHKTSCVCITGDQNTNKQTDTKLTDSLPCCKTIST